MKYFLAFLIFSIEVFGNIGSITLLKGNATITRKNSTLEAKLGGIIYPSDRINTYKKSKLKIILNDDTTLTIGQNTEYKIDSYNDKKNPNLQMTLISGLLTTISGKIGKIAPHKFNLKTKTSIIGIRGTKWKTFVGEKSQNSVCLKGAITIRIFNKTYEIPAGYMLLTKDGISRKFKTNLAFFNRLVAKQQANQRLKAVPKITPIQKKLLLNKQIKIKNSDINSKVKAGNIKISKDASANVGNIKLD